MKSAGLYRPGLADGVDHFGSGQVVAADDVFGLLWRMAGNLGNLLNCRAIGIGKGYGGSAQMVKGHAGDAGARYRNAMLFPPICWPFCVSGGSLDASKV